MRKADSMRQERQGGLRALRQIGAARKDKSGTLRRKSEFDAVKQSGRKQVGRFAILLVAASGDSLRRFGVICGRKFSPNAVERNRARRLLCESFRLIKKAVPPVWLVAIPRRPILDVKAQEVQAELIRLLSRAGAWNAPPDAAATPPLSSSP